MTIESIAALAQVAEPEGFLPVARAEVSPAGFGDWFAQELGAVNNKLVQVDHSVQSLALGGTQSLHEVMINMEEARQSFQLLVQVRNRLLESYQEVMRMQV